MIVLQVLREIAEGRITPVVQGRGADECIRLMNEGQIKVGRVVCMLRSNTHAVLKDGAHPGRETLQEDWLMIPC